MTAHPTLPVDVDDVGSLTPVWELVPGRHELRVEGEWLLVVAVHQCNRRDRVHIAVDGGRLFCADPAASHRARPVAMRSCSACGCTDDEACPGGCSWSDHVDSAGELLCSRCV